MTAVLADTEQRIAGLCCEFDSGLRIENADPQGSAALTLLAEAAAEARRIYPEFFSPGSAEPSNGPTPAGGVYLLACEGARPVASGALRPIDARTGEIRRMFVTADRRRQGLASAMLAALEQRAAALGYTRLRLETGDRQAPAMALYARRGFIRIPAFGRHADDPTSVCFEKACAPPAG